MRNKSYGLLAPAHWRLNKNHFSPKYIQFHYFAAIFPRLIAFLTWEYAAQGDIKQFLNEDLRHNNSTLGHVKGRISILNSIRRTVQSLFKVLLRTLIE
jgi:hypothetical protein